MKKLLLALLGLAALFVGAVVAQTVSGSSVFTISSNTSSSTSLTTQIQVARVQGDPAADGTLTFTVYTKTVITDAAGNVVSSTWGPTPLTVPVTGQLLTDLTSAINTAAGQPTTP